VREILHLVLVVFVHYFEIPKHTVFCENCGLARYLFSGFWAVF